MTQTNLKLFATNITGVPELGLVGELVLLTTRLTLNFLPQISQVCPNSALWVSSEQLLLTTRLTLNFLPQISQVCPNSALWVSSEQLLLTTRLTLNFLLQISQVCPNSALWVIWCFLSYQMTHLKLFATNITGVPELGLVGEQ